MDDAITVLQNLVIAVNDLAHTYYDIEGSESEEAISTSMLIKKGPGRICRVAVTTAGTTVGSVYDAASVSLAVAAELICTIPNTVGIMEIKIPVEDGIVIVPGTGQVMTVSYS